MAMTKRSMRRSLGPVLGGFGTATVALAFVLAWQAPHAAAWEGSCFDSAPTDRSWTELVVPIRSSDIDALRGVGQTFSDGSLSVTITNPIPADASAALTADNVGAVDFSATPGVDAVYVRAGAFDDRLYQYYPPAPVQAGQGLTSLATTVPIDWLSFCYVPSEVAATTTTTTTAPAPTTTVTVAPAAEVVAPVTSTVAPTVLAQTETAPTLAFTGRSSEPLLFLGAALIASGAVVEALARRTRHAEA
jgi:hypothetical protein